MSKSFGNWTQAFRDILPYKHGRNGHQGWFFFCRVIGYQEVPTATFLNFYAKLCLRRGNSEEYLSKGGVNIDLLPDVFA